MPGTACSNSICRFEHKWIAIQPQSLCCSRKLVLLGALPRPVFQARTVHRCGACLIGRCVIICCLHRYNAKMDERNIKHNLHLFVDTANAPPRAIFSSINKICEQVDAKVLVMAANSKV
jgi:hypothetical protein